MQAYDDTIEETVEDFTDQIKVLENHEIRTADTDDGQRYQRNSESVYCIYQRY